MEREYLVTVSVQLVTFSKSEEAARQDALAQIYEGDFDLQDAEVTVEDITVGV